MPAKPFTWTDANGVTWNFPSQKDAAAHIGVRTGAIQYYIRQGYAGVADLRKPHKGKHILKNNKAKRRRFEAILAKGRTG